MINLLKWANGLACFSLAIMGAFAQSAKPDDVSGAREPIAETASAYDSQGRLAISGRLKAVNLSGKPDAPVREARIEVQNRSNQTYNYISGLATFYDGDGVRCGTGLWKSEALSPGEPAIVDTPGLQLICSPVAWRLVLTNVVALNAEQTSTSQVLEKSESTNREASGDGVRNKNLEIVINGTPHPLQLGKPVEITLGKETVSIIVQPARANEDAQK